MSKLDRFISDLAEEEFPAAIQKVNSYVYEMLEGQQSKSGGGKVTLEILRTVKKCMDYVSLRLVKAHRDCVSNEAKLKTMITDNKAYEALIKQRSGTDESMSERLGGGVMKKKVPKSETGFSVLITPTEGSVQDIREEIKRISKTIDDFPKLSDVVSTKAGQLVLKVVNKQDTEKIKTTMQVLADKVKISVPRRRRKRVLLLSLETDMAEGVVLDSIRAVLEENGIQELKEIEVIRKYNTRAGKINWVLDVDNDCFSCLMEKKRLCIDFDRYRVVEYVQIVRCYKCQAYGHTSTRCLGTQKCTRCAGDHRQSDCTINEESCANCILEDGENDSGHRADSPKCPCFIKYRQELLAHRL